MTDRDKKRGEQKYKKYLENEKSFFGETKNNFQIFERLSFGGKIKNSEHKL